MNSFFGQYGCVCFGWKSLSKMFFRKWWCLVGPKNRIFRKLISIGPKKMALTTEIILHFHFHFKVFPEKERERERVLDRWWSSSSPVRRSLANPEFQFVSISQAPVRRPRLVPSIAISWRRSQSRSQSREDRDLAFVSSCHRSKARLRRRSRSTTWSSDWAREAPRRRTQSSVDRW